MVIAFISANETLKIKIDVIVYKILVENSESLRQRILYTEK